VKQLNRPRRTGCVRLVGLAAAYLLILRTMHSMVSCFDGRTHPRLILDRLSGLAPAFSHPPFQSAPLARRNLFLRGRLQLKPRVWLQRLLWMGSPAGLKLIRLDMRIRVTKPSKASLLY
jgi:hypothetical protein